MEKEATFGIGGVDHFFLRLLREESLADAGAFGRDDGRRLHLTGFQRVFDLHFPPIDGTIRVGFLLHAPAEELRREKIKTGIATETTLTEGLLMP